MKYLKKFNETLDRSKINPHNQEVMFHDERKEYFHEDFIDGKFVTVWLGKDYIPDGCECVPCKCDELMDDELEREIDEIDRKITLI